MIVQHGCSARIVEVPDFVLDCKTVGFFLKISKEIGKARRKSINSVSPQSHSPFSASFQTFCLTARAYLNTQKYGLFSSLTSSPGSSPFSKLPFWKLRSHGDDDVKLTHAGHSRKVSEIPWLFPDFYLTNVKFFWPTELTISQISPDNELSHPHHPFNSCFQQVTWSVHELIAP